MYESPIETIYGELQTQILREDENMIMKAVREVKINVDKDELIKALQYDRHQYIKGYNDGKNDILIELRNKIKEITDTMGVSYNQYINVIDILNIIDDICRKK